MATVPRAERAAGRQSAYKRGLALPPASPGGEPGYPIPDAAHWDKARQAVGRVRDPARRAALAKLLRKTAPQFGRTQALKQSWAAPKGASMAGDYPGLDFAVRARDSQGFMLTCPECGHVAPAGDFGASGASLQKSPGDLRTPARGTGFVRSGAATTVRGGNAAHALANTGTGVELAGTAAARRLPVQGPLDVIVARGADGTAMIRHRNGGADIAALRKNPDGTWTAAVNGKDLQPHVHQRAALMEAVGTWNKALQAGIRAQSAPLQREPEQTPLMAQYGIPAMRSAAFATPTTSAASGPRMNVAGGLGNDADGLSPKGRAIYKRLRARGLDEQAAMTMAKRAQAMKTARAA